MKKEIYKSFLVASVIVSAVVIGISANTASAATVNVTVGQSMFSPKNVEVNVGDTVVWTNVGSQFHTITAENGSFDRFLVPAATFRYTFNTQGTFPYYCRPHGGPGGVGMSGTVTVRASGLGGGVVLGNEVTTRGSVDSRSNFTIIDTNKQASANAKISAFRYYAASTNPFHFVLVDAANRVRWVSPQIIPPTIGVNSYAPSVAVSISSGWRLGAHFQSTGTIPYDNTGAPALYTGANSGLPVVGSVINFEGSAGRTYSLAAVSGQTENPAPSFVFPGFIYGKTEYSAGGLNRYASFFATSYNNRSPYIGSGTLLYSDDNGDWYRVSVSRVAVLGDAAYLAGRVVSASRQTWVNQWLYAKVYDGGTSGDQIYGSFMSSSEALRHFNLRNNLVNPPSGPFNISKGDLMVVSGLEFARR